MTDPATRLATLRRPKLLIRAARFGLEAYDRKRDLRRLLHGGVAPTPRAAVETLFEEEALLEEGRTGGQASYSPARHVDVLIALIAEARLLAAGYSAAPRGDLS
ncbi:MAG TPA: hypothetical protein ENK63_04575 [Rhodobacterales bacterium]|nr:hypothetical protein [Rhodobacterales bacterium]